MLIIVLPFIVFVIVWFITWFSVKRTAERLNFSERLPYTILGAIAVLMLIYLSNAPFFGASLFPSSFAAQSIGFFIEVLGLCFTVWARLTIGSNWSSDVTFKKKHELVTNGPYRLVRHPIYTGLIAMFLGVAIYLGIVAGFLATLSIFLSFLIKSRQEETMMMKHFPKEYYKYKKHTNALIPFIY